MTEALSSYPDLRAAAEGDRDAYHRVVFRNRNLVSSIAYAVVRDLPSSEDISQEVFLHAWVGLNTLKTPESFLPWLRQLTRNRALQFLRQRHRRADRPVGDAAELDGEVDPKPGAESKLLEKEQEQRLSAAIDALPDETREVVLLFYREGRSVAQVASLLDVSEDAVKKRLSRARDRLREALETEIGPLAEQSRPGDRFCSSVIAALPLAGPTTGAGVGTALLKAGIVGKAFSAVAGASGGAAFAVLGLLYGHRRAMKRALDDSERAELRRLRNLGLVLILGTSVVLILGSVLSLFRLVLASGYAFTAAMLYLFGPRLMRLNRRRWAKELAVDPTAGARHRREKWMAYAGLAFGVGSSLAALIGMTAWEYLHVR